LTPVSILVYFQPIDVDLFQGRVFDYLRGKGTLDELRPELVRVETLRRTVGPWESLLMDANYHHREKLPDWYNDDVVALERPFLITEDLPARVGELADQYHQAATPEAVRPIIDSQMAHLDPAGWNDPVRWSPEPPDFSGVEAEADQVLARLAPYASPVQARGDKKKSLDLEFASALLNFNKSLQPVWFVQAWFTEAIVEASRELLKCFETPDALFQPLFRSHPELKEALAQPYRNEKVGLYVRPENVARARKAAEAVLPTPVSQDGRETADYVVNALRRLAECLCYAERRGLGFAERIC
jgi:hypothetical protein